MSPNLDWDAGVDWSLNLTIYTDDNNLHTKVFRKESDCNSLLSFHPPHQKKNLPYGQVQRVRRICDSDSDFEEEADGPCERFKGGSYEPLEKKAWLVNHNDKPLQVPQRENFFFCHTL